MSSTSPQSDQQTQNSFQRGKHRKPNRQKNKKPTPSSQTFSALGFCQTRGTSRCWSSKPWAISWSFVDTRPRSPALTRPAASAGRSKRHRPEGPQRRPGFLGPKGLFQGLDGKRSRDMSATSDHGWGLVVMETRKPQETKKKNMGGNQ